MQSWAASEWAQGMGPLSGQIQIVTETQTHTQTHTNTHTLRPKHKHTTKNLASHSNDSTAVHQRVWT